MFKKRNDFKQEIFDKVSKHLLEQNERAVEHKDCKYRTSTGLKCAAGCLIPDNDYSPKMEKTIVVGLDFFQESGYSSEEIQMIGILQQIHDLSEPKHWKRQLKTLAKEHELVCGF